MMMGDGLTMGSIRRRRGGLGGQSQRAGGGMRWAGRGGAAPGTVPERGGSPTTTIPSMSLSVSSCRFWLREAPNLGGVQETKQMCRPVPSSYGAVRHRNALRLKTPRSSRVRCMYLSPPYLPSFSCGLWTLTRESVSGLRRDVRTRSGSPLS